MGELFRDLPDGPFQIIYADPPWHYEQQVFENGVPHFSAARHYNTIKFPDLCSIRVADIADDRESLLFLWATGSCLDEAVSLGKAWEFKYITVAFIWDKQKVVVGNYTMSQCEYVLVFKRGRIPKPRGARNIQQFLSRKSGRHAAKPYEIRARIDAMFPTQRKIELFARSAPDGWAVWGDQADSGRALGRARWRFYEPAPNC